VVDDRWTAQPLALLIVLVAVALLRLAPVRLSKFSYLTQIGIPALVAALATPPSVAVLGLAGGVFLADLLLSRKPVGVAAVNAGRETLGFAVAYGFYALALQVSGASTLSLDFMAPFVVLAGCHRGRREAPPAPAPAPVETAPEPRFRTGADVVEAMHDRYAGKWYSSLTFKQKTSRLLPNGKWNVQTWWEAMKLPGRLRIEFDPVRAGNGVLYARDSQFVVQNGRALRGDPGINPLLLLGFDVYSAPVAYTTARLRREGFDLTRVHETTFQGRPMIVVGARKGDYNRKQFWVDAERMLFVRMLEPTPRDTTKMQDIRFVNYERRGNGWIAPRVEIWSEQKLVFYEDYEDVRVDVPLDDALFVPSRWKTARHWSVTAR
jgi:hypothetical protein